jgi:hypothetical protein
MATKTKNKDFELDPEWIYQDPIDFEHKKYKLLAYLQKCDKRFDELKIYPDFVDAISVQIKKNKDRLEDGMGYIYFRRRSDEKLLVWEYEIKKEADYELSTKAYLNLIFSGSSDEKTFTDIIEEKSTWNHTEYFKDIPVFEVKSSQEFPFEETFIPMMKRQLMSYVFQVVNYKKMRNLED